MFFNQMFIKKIIPSLPGLDPRIGPHVLTSELLAFSFGRWDSEQGKMHPMRKNIIMILADQKAQKYPLEQMEGVGRRTSIFKCQALYSVCSFKPHLSS